MPLYELKIMKHDGHDGRANDGRHKNNGSKRMPAAQLPVQNNGQQQRQRNRDRELAARVEKRIDDGVPEQLVAHQSGEVVESDVAGFAVSFEIEEHVPERPHNGVHPEHQREEQTR
jgi:hypothetical protein